MNMPYVASYNGSLSWSDADGNVFRPHPFAQSCPYAVADSGMLPVADQTPAGTEIDLSPTGIVQGATLVWIENKTGQELNMAWGGNWMPHLSAGGLFVWAVPTLPSSGPIIGLRFMLTQTQAGAGCIAYAFMGA